MYKFKRFLGVFFAINSMLVHLTAVSSFASDIGAKGIRINKHFENIKEISAYSDTYEVDDYYTYHDIMSPSVKVTVGEKSVVVGNDRYDMDAAAYIQPDSNSVLIPMRFVAVAIIGGSIGKADSSSFVKWDEDTKTAAITVGVKNVKFTANSNIMTVNSSPIVIDNGAAAEIKNGRMYIPFKALGEALGIYVVWDDETKTSTYTTGYAIGY